MYGRNNQDSKSTYKTCCLGTGWENAEFRSYRFLDGDNESASLGETPESQQGRSSRDKSFTEAEKNELTETAAKTWEAQTHKKINRDRRTGPCACELVSN